MNETDKRENYPNLKKEPGFKKGNKLAVGHQKAYTVRAREFAETKGWAKLERWAESRNYKASIAALTTILAYAYGRPREAIKFEGSMPLSIQQWFLSVRNAVTIVESNGGISVDGSGQPNVVLPGSFRDNGMGKANGNSRKHSGQA